MQGVGGLGQVQFGRGEEFLTRWGRTEVHDRNQAHGITQTATHGEFPTFRRERVSAGSRRHVLQSASTQITLQRDSMPAGERSGGRWSEFRSVFSPVGWGIPPAIGSYVIDIWGLWSLIPRFRPSGAVGLCFAGPYGDSGWKPVA